MPGIAAVPRFHRHVGTKQIAYAVRRKINTHGRLESVSVKGRRTGIDFKPARWFGYGNGNGEGIKIGDTVGQFKIQLETATSVIGEAAGTGQYSSYNTVFCLIDGQGDTVIERNIEVCDDGSQVFAQNRYSIARMEC